MHNELLSMDLLLPADLFLVGKARPASKADNLITNCERTLKNFSSSYLLSKKA
jgi:hypothetical protein